jgi:chemotaxis protein histidine kinase CheA
MATAAPVIPATPARGTAATNTGTPKASADDAKEMTEEELEQKYPEAMKKIKAKAAAQAAAEAAKAAMEAAPKEEEKAAAKSEAKSDAKATASVTAAAGTPATIGELKAAFPDDGAYCFSCLEQGLDMQAALLGKVKAQAAQIESLQSGRAKPASTPAASGSAPAIPSSAALAAGGNVPVQFATFDEAMSHELAQAKAAGVPMSRGQALINCHRKYPELHAEKFLAARK